MMLVAQIPNSTANALCSLYTATRVAYHLSYILIPCEKLSYVRAYTWLIATGVCIVALVISSIQPH